MKAQKRKYYEITAQWFFTVSLIAVPLWSAAQTNMLLQQGNNQYKKGNYAEATSDYLKALRKDPTNTAGLFNLGNALYQQKQYDSSRRIMAATASNLKDKNGKAAVNYNIGNTYMAQKKWEDAIDAYKKTLRNNTQDADAKYNLAYAKEMLKKEQQQSGGGKDKEKDKDKNQDKDNKDKNKDKQDNKDDQKEGDKQDQQEKGDQKDQRPQSEKSKLSQQQAEQLLNALQQEEKKLQDKLKNEKGIPVKLDKDW